MWLGWQPALVIAGTLVVVGLVARRHEGRVAAVGAVARETALVLTLYAFWRLVMTFRSTRLDEGLAHGRTVYDIERALHIGNEADMARWLVDHPTIAHLANDFYATVHVPALIAFLVWLFVRHRASYPALRNTVAGVTGVCLFLHWFPVAPPRMYPALGFIDVAKNFGQSVYGPVGQGISNQVSALPSLHAGWAMIVALGVIVASKSRWRWWILAHPIVTMLVISATANHWWLDSIAAGAVLALVLAAQWAVDRLRGRRPAMLDLTDPVSFPDGLEPSRPALRPDDGDGPRAAAAEPRWLDPAAPSGLPVGRDRSDLDGSTETGGRDRAGHLHRAGEVIGLHDGEAADGVLRPGIGPGRGGDLAVGDAHRHGILGQPQRWAGGDALHGVQPSVVGVDRLLLLVGQGRPSLGLGGQRGRPLVDHQHELHGGVLSWWFEAPEDQTVCHIAAVPGVMSMTPQDGGM